LLFGSGESKASCRKENHGKVDSVSSMIFVMQVGKDNSNAMKGEKTMLHKKRMEKEPKIQILECVSFTHSFLCYA